jgi:GDP-D-mannose 3',5'-epimerase
MSYKEYWRLRDAKTAMGRFNNVDEPFGTWDGGREKASAALCRKFLQAMDTGNKEIPTWCDGHQRRSVMYIDDCVKGIDQIMRCGKTDKKGFIFLLCGMYIK